MGLRCCIFEGCGAQLNGLMRDEWIEIGKFATLGFAPRQFLSEKRNELICTLQKRETKEKRKFVWFAFVWLVPKCHCFQFSTAQISAVVIEQILPLPRPFKIIRWPKTSKVAQATVRVLTNRLANTHKTYQGGSIAMLEFTLYNGPFCKPSTFINTRVSTNSIQAHTHTTTGPLAHGCIQVALDCKAIWRSCHFSYALPKKNECTSEIKDETSTTHSDRRSIGNRSDSNTQWKRFNIVYIMISQPFFSFRQTFLCLCVHSMTLHCHCQWCSTWFNMP